MIEAESHTDWNAVYEQMAWSMTSDKQRRDLDRLPERLPELSEPGLIAFGKSVYADLAFARQKLEALDELDDPEPDELRKLVVNEICLRRICVIIADELQRGVPASRRGRARCTENRLRRPRRHFQLNRRRLT